MKLLFPLLILILPLQAYAACDIDGNCGDEQQKDTNALTRSLTEDNRVPAKLETDSLGITRGTIGDNTVKAFTDQNGTMRGHIGDETFKLQDSATGGSEGFIGDREVRCDADRIGQMRCR